MVEVGFRRLEKEVILKPRDYYEGFAQEAIERGNKTLKLICNLIKAATNEDSVNSVISEREGLRDETEIEGFIDRLFGKNISSLNRLNTKEVRKLIKFTLICELEQKGLIQVSVSELYSEYFPQKTVDESDSEKASKAPASKDNKPEILIIDNAEKIADGLYLVEDELYATSSSLFKRNLDFSKLLEALENDQEELRKKWERCKEKWGRAKGYLPGSQPPYTSLLKAAANPDDEANRLLLPRCGSKGKNGKARLFHLEDMLDLVDPNNWDKDFEIWTNPKDGIEYVTKQSIRDVSRTLLDHISSSGNLEIFSTYNSSTGKWVDLYLHSELLKNQDYINYMSLPNLQEININEKAVPGLIDEDGNLYLSVHAIKKLLLEAFKTTAGTKIAEQMGELDIESKEIGGTYYNGKEVKNVILYNVNQFLDKVELPPKDGTLIEVGDGDFIGSFDKVRAKMIECSRVGFSERRKGEIEAVKEFSIKVNEDLILKVKVKGYSYNMALEKAQEKIPNAS
jgi:hypothetical protein